MFIDTHCHPYMNKDKKIEEIAGNFKKEGGKYMICIGVDIKSNKKSIELAKKYDFIKATIGIHPCDIKNLDLDKTIGDLEKMYLENKQYIVGIGECGLDYYWLKAENNKEIQKYNEEYQNKIINLQKKLQKIFFKAQIELAKKYNLPFIIHNRESRDDVLSIIKEVGYKKFIFHCFSEDLGYAKDVLDYSNKAMLSFSGIVTFKNAKDIQETAKNIPLKNILIETDSPYLTPTPHRGKQENESSYTKYVLDKIIELRNEDKDKDKIEKQIFDNSIKTFGLGK